MITSRSPSARWLFAFLLAASTPAFADESREPGAMTGKEALTAPAPKKPRIEEGASDRRMVYLAYDPNEVYLIRTRFGYQTHIEFAPSEEIQTISVGDRSQWQIIPANNRLFIRPMGEDMTTNMTVLTNQRSYQFDLKAGNIETKKQDIIYVARFIYPDAMPQSHDDRIVDLPVRGPVVKPVTPPAPVPPKVIPFSVGASPYVKPGEAPVPASEGVYAPPPAPAPAPATSAPAPQEALTANQPPIAAPNYNYTFVGPEELAPYQVYDDGASTYVVFTAPPRAKINLAVVRENGVETPVRYEMQGATLKANRIGGEWILRSQSGTVKLFNEAAEHSK